MKHYLIILKQNGEGCDYTIGCGMNIKFIDLEDNKSILDEVLKRFVNDDFYVDCENGLESCKIYEVTGKPLHDIDMKNYYKNLDELELIREKKAEYDILKERYEKLKISLKNNLLIPNLPTR